MGSGGSAFEDATFHQLPSVSNGSGLSLRVRVVNIPEQSSRVGFDGKLPTRLNQAGCQWVHP